MSGIAARDDAPITHAVSDASLAASDRTAHAVVLEGISKSFPVRRAWGEMLRHPTHTPRAPVLQNISLAVAEGEFFGLLGPNGAGKTTLFRMLATLVLPDSGTATVGGYDVVSQSAKVRSVLAPVIADERSLYWRLTASQNLELFATLQGLRGAAVQRRVKEVLDVVGLGDTAEKIVAAFSSGMKQRLLIARALVAQPRVLLLDEPTRSLDPISARGFRTFLREEISGRQGCTVLLATHSADEVLELCTRVAVLDHGRLLATGTTTSLARDLGEERYALYTRNASHPALAALVQRGVVGALLARGNEDGWARVDMEIAGGMERASQVVATLGEQGVVIARFERVPLPLADLIDRIVHRHARVRLMREALALMQASWRTQRSYRVSIVLSILSLGVTVLPVYFMAKALQSVMAASIANQGGNYFGFLVIGFISIMFVSTTVSSIPDAIGAGIGNGHLRGAACRHEHRSPRCWRGWSATASCGRR